MQVELLFFDGCPHVEAARRQLRRAFAELGRPAEWAERDLALQQGPRFGSPTVLVNGRDVAGGEPAEALACRVYFETDEPGAPPLSAIVSALRAG